MGNFSELTVSYLPEQSEPAQIAYSLRESLDNECTDIEFDPQQFARLYGVYSEESSEESAKSYYLNKLGDAAPDHQADYSLPFVAHDDSIAYAYFSTHDTASFSFFTAAFVRLAVKLRFSGTVICFESHEGEYWGWANVFRVEKGASEAIHERELVHDAGMGEMGDDVVKELTDAGYRLASYRTLKRPSFQIHRPES